jgi:hypothetical protein
LRKAEKKRNGSIEIFRRAFHIFIRAPKAETKYFGVNHRSCPRLAEHQPTREHELNEALETQPTVRTDTKLPFLLWRLAGQPVISEAHTT